MSDRSPTSVIYVDEDEAALETVATALGAHAGSFDVTTTTDPSDVLDRLDRVDCVLSGSELDGRGPIDLLRSVRETAPEIPFVLFVNVEAAELLTEALDAGVTELVPRSLGEADAELLARRIENAVGRARTERELTLKDRAMEEAEIGITIADATRPDTPLIYVNEAFETVTGYTAEEATGRNCRFLQGPETDPEQVAAIRDGIENAEPVSVELTNYRKDGEAFANKLDIVPVQENGTVTYFLGFQRDVSERRERERRAKRFEAARDRFYQITTDPDRGFEAKLEGVLELGTELLDLELGFLTRITEDTQRIVAVTGDHEEIRADAACPLSEAYCRRTIEAEAPLGVRDAVADGWEGDPAYERFELGCYLGAKVATGEELYGTLCFADRTPRERAFTTEERAFVELAGRWAGSELGRREYERELRAERDRFAALFENLPDPVVALDLTGGTPTVRSVNGAFEDVFGYAEDAVRGSDLNERLQPRASDATAVPGLDDPVDANEEVRLRTTDGQRIFRRLTVPVGGEYEGYTHYVMYFDITDQKQREERLGVLARTLRHDLRNRLSVVEGNAALLGDEVTDDTDETLAGQIEKAARELHELSERIRMMERTLSTGTDPDPVDIVEVVRNAIDTVSETYPNAAFDTDLPDEAWTDATDALGIAIANVIENAVEHNDGSAPAVEITVKDSEDGWVDVVIADDGPGIPETEARVVADDGSTTQLEHASGLGLWFTNWIVTDAGGNVNIESDPEGTVVRIRMPVTEPPTERSADAGNRSPDV